ncbi:VWA domain-containing protein [Massilia sp. PAMC28688]|uniref:vWA domain-containing protein n=1 Tax=Massilia sp. PAMC28688 TaxID=2861283 RepID=UPI001C62B3CC|nr:VWA domain-containing protein [Massilia sp. PAMC28688]QYF95235.1 VWA domain-containing protein [Massilia sp. PAMC28688]
MHRHPEPVGSSPVTMFMRNSLALAAGMALLAGCSHQSPGEVAQAPTTVAPQATQDTQDMQVTPVAPPVAEALAPPPAPVPQATAARHQRNKGRAVTVAGNAYARAHGGYMAHSYALVPAQANKFPEGDVNGLKLVAEQPMSTFSVDVDTASYAYVRRLLSAGTMPPSSAVRVEEMVNYFPYKYVTPTNRAQPFEVTTAVMPNPWKSDTQLVHIGVRGFDIEAATRPRANVVLLIDVSGSMSGDDRLTLLKKSFAMFAARLRADDHVSIVAYAGGAQVLLEPTPGSQKDKIVGVINALHAGGSTAGAEGLQRAYALAQRNFDKAAVNRVILATDGDFNVGISDPKELEKYVAAKRKSGVYLSILGVGDGNLNDAMMQRLAQSGNGNAAYIDTLMEARKALSEELGSTMFPIANDVKVQVEFNPAQVAAYRLIGYETRMLEKQDFNDDKVDAGDMGAGHTVTALYEITPASSAARLVDPLRYQAPANRSRVGTSGELCLVKVRYKLPGQPDSKLIQHVVQSGSAYTSLAAVPDDQRFAVAVAAFGQRLRSEKEVGNFSYGAIAELANGARGSDAEGYRAEFVKLVRMADSMSKVSQLGQP